MGKMRSNSPTGEARSARVNTQSRPSGLLSYATKGQMTVRPQAMSGKPSFSKTVGHYPTKGK